MSTVVESKQSEQPWEADPWRYGWRYVEVQQADGTVRLKTKPCKSAFSNWRPNSASARTLHLE